MPTPTLESKFPNMGTNIFTAMNSVAAEYGAINLGQGFPNFDSPEELVGHVTEAFRSAKNQYAPMPGIIELREAIAEKINFMYKRTVDPVEEITVTPGGHIALMSACSAVLHPGDEVIIFEPSFDCFAPIVHLNGALPVFIKLKFPNYTIDWSEVKSKITSKTRMIWINTPHNPTGSVFTKADIDELTAITRATNILILSDEVYEHIYFDQHQHESVLRYPELADRSFSVYSFGKVYHATGWKVGYCVAPKPLMKEFRKIYQMISFTTNHPVQIGLARYLKKRDHYLELPKFYQRKRDLFLNGIKNSRFDAIPSGGSYFQNLTYSRIGKFSDKDAALNFAKDAKVVGIPLSAFYSDGTDDGVLRFCFAKTDDIITQAAEALSKI